MKTAERNAALERLMFAIRQMVDQGEIVPCLNRDRSYLWISDDPHNQAAASLGCQSCPALEACGLYVRTNQEPCGVWAGLLNGRPVKA